MTRGSADTPSTQFNVGAIPIRLGSRLAGYRVINRSTAGTVWVGPDPFIGDGRQGSTPIYAGTSLTWEKNGDLYAVRGNDVTDTATVMITNQAGDWQPDPAGIAAAVALDLFSRGIRQANDMTVIRSGAAVTNVTLGPYDCTLVATLMFRMSAAGSSATATINGYDSGGLRIWYKTFRGLDGGNGEQWYQVPAKFDTFDVVITGTADVDIVATTILLPERFDSLNGNAIFGFDNLAAGANLVIALPAMDGLADISVSCFSSGNFYVAQQVSGSTVNIIGPQFNALGVASCRVQFKLAALYASTVVIGNYDGSARDFHYLFAWRSD